MNIVPGRHNVTIIVCWAGDLWVLSGCDCRKFPKVCTAIEIVSILWDLELLVRQLLYSTDRLHVLEPRVLRAVLGEIHDSKDFTVMVIDMREAVATAPCGCM